MRCLTDPLLSQDLSGSTCAATIDERFIEVKGHALYLVLWYDNEWDYAAQFLRVLRTALTGAPT